MTEPKDQRQTEKGCTHLPQLRKAALIPSLLVSSTIGNHQPFPSFLLPFILYSTPRLLVTLISYSAGSNFGCLCSLLAQFLLFSPHLSVTTETLLFPIPPLSCQVPTQLVVPATYSCLVLPQKHKTKVPTTCLTSLGTV